MYKFFNFRVYLESIGANRFLKRTFFHPKLTACEEQKREAREDYEERCEPSFPLFRDKGTRRYCPDIHNWKAFDNYEIGDGYSEDNIFTNVPSNNDQPDYLDQQDIYDRNNKYKNRRLSDVITNDDDTNDYTDSVR